VNKFTQIICLSVIVSGCSGLSDYAKNILSDPRNEKLVYKTDDDYSSGQIDLIIPPDLSQPNTRNSLTLPEIANNDSEKLFTIDSELENIKIYKQGKDMFLAVNTDNKIALWNQIKQFWLQEGFQILNEDITIASIRTNYLENLSEAQLGTIQKVVGRYVPLLVSPETRDSYSTRLIKKENGYDILITHYGKEFMSDGDTDFRWQNRPRDPEFENEMISRMYIYLGGDEAREAGLIVSKSTGVRKKASIFTDDQGLQTLYIPDIYERVYPTVITSLEVLGVNIINQNQSSGTIEVTLEDKVASSQGFFANLFGTSTSENLNIKVGLGDQGKSTLITIENDTFTQINSPASEEVLRGLFVNLR
jgi:outer membrane protein assembly factor BamC